MSNVHIPEELQLAPLPDCVTHGKRLHVTRDGARAVIRRLHSPGMREYKCDVHDGLWHIGHTPDSIRKGDHTSAEYYGLAVDDKLTAAIAEVRTAPRRRIAGTNTDHHTPNVLPAGHTRAHYDVDYADGVWGPVRLPAVPEANIPAQVWCRRHGWEPEVRLEGDLFRAESDGGNSWGWRCGACKKSKIKKSWTKEQAHAAHQAHVRDVHRDGHGGQPLVGRLPGGKADRREAAAARKAAATGLVCDHTAEELIAGLDYLERERPGSIELALSLIGRLDAWNNVNDGDQTGLQVDEDPVLP